MSIFQPVLYDVTRIATVKVRLDSIRMEGRRVVAAYKGNHIWNSIHDQRLTYTRDAFNTIQGR